MKIKFIGAAQTVTGSMHYIEAAGKKFILDCGLIQGKRKESFELNKKFDQFAPSELDFVILSHAHIDHAGNLPNLVKHGFNGNIYCTFATRDLASLMLTDSAHIQEKDVEFVNKRRRKQGKNLFEPLYTQNDVDKTIPLFVGLNYHREFEITQDISIIFFDAGHILGSAITYLRIKEEGRIIDFGFSGDIGRPNLPILRDPEKIPNVDYFICESTYGGRFHDNFDMTQSKMIEVLQRAEQRKAKIIVPSFSVGRTQELVIVLNKIFEQKLVKKFPIFVDSPLSVSATGVFRMHPECFDLETSQFLLENKDPFGFDNLTYITDVEESKKLNELSGPCMIISSSGMAEAGRILHHLANNIQNPNNIILIVGYSAEHTLGRKIVEREPVVKIFGEEYNLNAEVVVFNSLSAHADSNELLQYCNNFDKSKLQKIFLVHGDLDQQQKFKSRLEENGFLNIIIPTRADEFQI
ncbi:MAG: MBL fold metallo-hydrolase [Ignavibacteriaceae bacterium]|nr:MBL fold metallo-hydrolase [Ignavibacteriaceae bacterium]HRI47493.1 MBL fold metallo-hydrolase [Ignavibacteriaceae bacterium]